LKGGRDAEARQQTLRATIEWSYDLLGDEEQRLFACLAVFRGGCTLEAAEEVCEADLDTLQGLVEKSLLRHSDERFWMLETIRELAAEQLVADDEESMIRDRHLEHFLALAERAYEERLTAESTWFPMVTAEHDNIRAALDKAETSRPREEVRLASAVAPYWFFQGLEAYERLTGSYPRPER
jgi:predicted ATPase